MTIIFSNLLSAAPTLIPTLQNNQIGGLLLIILVAVLALALRNK